MKNLTLMQKIFGHLKTVHKHRKLVRKYCFECGLFYQGLTHDLSKYSPSELFESIKYYQGYRSPYSYEKELYGYALGWLHHKGRNKHHFEYWYDDVALNPTPIIPFKYMLEMICDRVAASKTYNKKEYKDSDSLKYLLKTKDKMCMNKCLIDYLERVFTELSKKGEVVLNKKYLKQLYDEYTKNDTI